MALVDGLFEVAGAVPPAGCGEEDVLAVDSKVSSLGVTGTELVSLGCSVVEPTAGAGDGFSSFGTNDSSDFGAIASDLSAFGADGADASELGFEATSWSVVSTFE